MAPVGGSVEGDDGGEEDVSKEDVEQEEDESYPVLKVAPAAHMCQNIIEVFQLFSFSFPFHSPSLDGVRVPMPLS